MIRGIVDRVLGVYFGLFLDVSSSGFDCRFFVFISFIHGAASYTVGVVMRGRTKKLRRDQVSKDAVIAYCKSAHTLVEDLSQDPAEPDHLQPQCVLGDEWPFRSLRRIDIDDAVSIDP